MKLKWTVDNFVTLIIHLKSKVMKAIECLKYGS